MSKALLPRNYWKLWSATFISNIGNGVTAIAFPWLASALTRSPLTIAIVGLMSQLPWLLFTLPAGVITDRLDRKKIIVATDLLRGVVTALAFFVQSWFILYLLLFLEIFFTVMWNIDTVTFRQTIIPTEILGRVNSGYRFFGWGSMPLGSLAGGLLVNILEHFISRELALRIPFLVAGGIGFATWGIVRKRFTSEKLQAAREK
jgi:MFS family permease